MIDKSRWQGELGIGDAAVELGVHRNTVYRLINQGTLEATKSRGRWVISRRALRKVAERSFPWVDSLQRVRRCLDEIRDIVTTSNAAIGLTTASGRFLAASDDYALLLGYNREWFYHHDYLDYIDPNERAFAKEQHANALSHPGRTVEHTRRVVNGWGRKMLVHFDVVAVPVDGSEISSLIVCRASRIEEGA